MDDDDFLGNTNSTDVLIDTANSEEMMAGSHITKFHKHKQVEPVTTELLNKVLNAPGVTCKHNVGRGHHNRSDTQSTTYLDRKLATRKDESFSFEVVRMKALQKLCGTPSTWWKDLSLICSWKQVTWMLLLWSKIITKRLQLVNKGRLNLLLYIKTTMVV